MSAFDFCTITLPHTVHFHTDLFPFCATRLAVPGDRLGLRLARLRIASGAERAPHDEVKTAGGTEVEGQLAIAHDAEGAEHEDLGAAEDVEVDDQLPNPWGTLAKEEAVWQSWYTHAGG
jgi:hypothetical protein